MNEASEFLRFRRMVTPVVIQAVFWIGVVVCVIGGLVLIGSGAVSNFGGGIRVLYGLMMLVVGPLLVRIYCELLIVMFRINETLTDIRRLLKPAEHNFRQTA